MFFLFRDLHRSLLQPALHACLILFLALRIHIIAPKASAEGACIFSKLVTMERVMGYYGTCMMGYCGTCMQVTMAEHGI